MKSFSFLKLGLAVGMASGSLPVCDKSSTAMDVAAGEDLGYQVAIVTGGDSGLGYAAAETLAKQGASVVIASHNEEKCQSAAHNISVSTGNAHVVGMVLDLGSFASVRAFVAKFLKRFDSLNYLLNNAGISGSGEAQFKTEDGFEGVFQVNYLGHFLLTELLLPTLRKSDLRGMPAIIVNTASSGHIMACSQIGADEDCFKDWTYLPTPLGLPPIVYNGTKYNGSTYGISKFAQIQHAAELAVREAGYNVQAFSIAPGLVATDMTTNTTKGHNFTAFCQAMQEAPVYIQQDPCPYTAQEGAAVMVAVALRAATTGRWYTRYTDCSDDKPVAEQGFTQAMRPELYRRSRQWVGLDVSSSSAVLV